MADTAFVATTVAVFALGGPRRTGGGQAVTAENIVGLIVAVALLGYLFLALLHPERCLSPA